jgi:hypothetical protein
MTYNNNDNIRAMNQPTLKTLTPALKMTLSLFTAKARKTSSEIADQLSFGMMPNDALHRLEKLRRMGKLDRELEGRSYVYFRTSK